MAVLESCPKHNMVAYVEKTDGNTEFHEIIDFLIRSSIHYALTVTAQAAEIKSLKAQVKKLKKQARPSILHHKAWLRTVKRKNQKKKKVLKTSKRRSVFNQGRKTIQISQRNKETGTESEDITKAKKKFNQVAHDEEVARKMQEEWEAKEDRKRLTEEEATKTALSNEYDFIQARIEVDRLLAERVQEAEREQFTVEERAYFFMIH
ncbi:hypothetical protein Tco_0536670 [Tanacetum coccineum]